MTNQVLPHGASAPRCLLRSLTHTFMRSLESPPFTSLGLHTVLFQGDVICSRPGLPRTGLRLLQDCSGVAGSFCSSQFAVQSVLYDQGCERCSCLSPRSSSHMCRRTSGHGLVTRPMGRTYDVGMLLCAEITVGKGPKSVSTEVFLLLPRSLSSW